MRRTVFSIFFLIFLLYGVSFAGSIAYQSFSWQILPVNEIWVSGNPSPLVIDSVEEVGGSLQEAVDDSTTYTVVTNEGGYVTPEKPKRITGAINQPMPQHTYLKINLVAPADAESMGDVELGTEAQTLVDYILVSDTDLGITYKFGATPEAGALSGSRVVTLVFTDSV